ncbi:MAG: NAD(P)/FAD-dependent oxidoreductase [Pseudomonadota bacterium]
MSKDTEHFDVVVIGAGISGISAGYHLQKHCPDLRFQILEARDAIGGTWDLFRYPGVRSDSDMFTLGYGFRPWGQDKSIADGGSIRNYVRETALQHGLVDKIQFNTRVTSMSWSTQKALWTITAEHNGQTYTATCAFIFSCAGYYRYAKGYSPDFKGANNFKGDIIHPQNWPEEYNYSGKRVVIIGSGATAVTLAPAMADKAAHVTLLQRSPSYFFSMPSESALARRLNAILPKRLAHTLMRWQRILFQSISFKLIRANPDKASEKLIDLAREKLPEGFDVERHFKPAYKPWDQRLCIVPDDDFFNAVSSRAVSIVTDHIAEFAPNGILLRSGETIKADAIVTATGLIVESFGGADIKVDHHTVNSGNLLTYKGCMFEGVPNFVSVFGYTNASWTLRADLINAFACRLINHMRRKKYSSVAPINTDTDLERDPFLDFSSGYVARAADVLPKQGARAPWRHPQDYLQDIFSLRFNRLEDGVLVFRKSATKTETAVPSVAETVS